MRQINRHDAEKLIMTTMSDIRRREVRKWRFGTHFTEFHRFANGTTIAMPNAFVRSIVEHKRWHD